MERKESFILETVQYNNKLFICQIRILSRAMEFYYGQPQSYTSNRWMQTENWAKFDAGMEKVFEKYNNIKSCDIIKFDNEKFYLNSLILVHIRKSNLSIKNLSRYFGHTKLNAKDVALCLECIIEYKEDGTWEDEKIIELTKKDVGNEHKYEPQYISDYKEKRTGGGLPSYVPYTPSTKIDLSSKNRTNNDITPDASSSTFRDIELYSPKPIIVITKDETTQSPPPYRPARIDKPSNKYAGVEYKSAESSKHVAENIKKVESSDYGNEEKMFDNAKKEKLRNKINDKKFPKGTKVIRSNDSKTNRTTEYLQEVMLSALKTDKDISLISTAKMDSNRISRNDILSSELRRSERTSCKPKRLIEDDQYNKTEGNRRSSSKSDSSPIDRNKNQKHKNLFGSDDESEEIASIMGNSKPVRKRLCDTNAQEKNNINTWLSKRKFSEIPSSSKKKRTRANKKNENEKLNLSSPSSNDSKQLRKYAFNKPRSFYTDKDIEQSGLNIIEQNQISEEMRLLTKRMKAPTPTKTVYLTFNEMTSSDIIETFEKYKPTIDVVFQELKDENYVYSYEGINHCFVIQLLDLEKQMDMMNKLATVYEIKDGTHSINGILYANAMLPEWIICIFMDKFNLTRAKAIKQINDQEAYKVYLEAQDDRYNLFN